MRLPLLPKDAAVEKLRWAMLAVMLAGFSLTLASQPSEYWSNPDSAIRGDGLGIHNPTNHTFEFFLGYGWPEYLACWTAYAAAAFFVVSTLPSWAALFVLFTVIFGHAYTGTNWLAIRWQGGMLASSAYGLGLGIPLAIVVGRMTRAERGNNRRLAWIAVATLLVDMSFTLLGQPDSYWSHPGTAHEGNVVSRYFLVHGWGPFVAYVAVYVLGLFRLISMLPRVAGLMVAFYFVFCDFCGASNWLFFVWRHGMQAVLTYACILSAALVIFAFNAPRPQAVSIPSAPPG